MRALAIVPVVIDHYYSPWLPGGGIGVGLFFSLSGFLIAGLLLNEGELTATTAAKFIFRRLMRIYPTYLLAIVAGAILCSQAGDAERLAGILKALPGLLTMSEMPVWLGYGFGVLWTLHVEFAFYVAMPIAMLIFGRRGLLIGSAVFTVSTVVCLIYPGAAVTPILRFGATLAFGSLVALGWKFGLIDRFVTMPRALLALSVAGTVALWMLPPDTQTHWTLETMVASLCGCGMIAAFLKDGQLRLLPLSAWIGRISYSMYLIHGLVIDYAYKVFDQHISSFEPDVLAALFLFAKIVVVASVLSFFLIEKPGIALGRALSRRLFGARTHRP